MKRPSIDVLEREDPVRHGVNAFVRRAAEGVAAGARVLDAGAGECIYRPLFEKQRYVAVDRGGGDREWNYGRLDAVADLERVPLCDGTFDYVLCTETLEHVRRPARVLAELRRVLRPGGTLALSVPFLHPVHQAPHDYLRFTPFALRALLEEAGLSVTGIEASGGYFLFLYWQLQAFPSHLPLGVRACPLTWLSWPARAFIRGAAALLRGFAWALRGKSAAETRPLSYFTLAVRK